MKLHGLQKAACLTLTLLTVLTANPCLPVYAGTASEETQTVSGKFVTTKIGTRYRLKGGGYAEGMLEIDGSLYYFDPDTHRMMEDEWFYLGEDRYYASADGPLLTGKQTVDGRTYYFNENGVCSLGCWYQEEDGTWLRLDTDGNLMTGWFEENGWYYLGDDGRMLSGEWLEWNGNWYYLNDNGKMAAGSWVNWKDEWYYLSGSGVMQKNCTVTTGGRKWYLDAYGRLEVSPDHPLDVPVVKQAPALPNGCEITALTELLRYNGFSVSHTTMSAKYLPRKHFTWSGGKMYGPDPNEYFIGNPEDDTGWYCLEGPIIAAANSYLAEQGSSLRAEKVSGADAEQLERYLKAGYPVMVWMTPGLREFGYSSVRWILPDGTTYKPYIGTHGLVLTGIDIEAGTASFSDPARGKHTLSLSFFLRIYKAMGSRAVIIR